MNLHHFDDKYTNADCVEEFMEGFGQEVKKTVEWPDEATVRLRVRVMCEEFIEVLRALMKGDIPELAKELCDCEYVNDGTAHAFGIPHDYIFSLVHDNNMGKLHYTEDNEPYVVRNDYGKIIKPPNYEPMGNTIIEALKESGYDENEKPNFDVSHIVVEEAQKYGIDLSFTVQK